CWLAERMKTFTRSSLFTISSVGPSRFASTGVRVFVSVRWTFFCSSGAMVLSGPGRGACAASVIDGTLLLGQVFEPDSFTFPQINMPSRPQAQVLHQFAMPTDEVIEMLVPNQLEVSGESIAENEPA